MHSDSDSSRRSSSSSNITISHSGDITVPSAPIEGPALAITVLATAVASNTAVATLKRSSSFTIAAVTAVAVSRIGTAGLITVAALPLQPLYVSSY